MAKKPALSQPHWSPYEANLPIIHDRILRGDIPPPGLLAQALEEHKDKVLPSWFVSIICAQLRGTLKRKRGPKDPTEWHTIFIELADWDYQRHLDWLKRRKASQGLKGWSCVRGKPWWSGAPHERALAIVYEQYCKHHKEFQHIGLRRFRNLISSRK